jgi:hypothetical protein
MVEPLLETDEEPRELEWSLGFAGDELVLCEMKAAVITTSPTVIAEITRERFRAARAVPFLADFKPHHSLNQ